MAFLIASQSMAEAYRRLVNFEWEPIEGASTYEIEIRKKGQTSKSNSFKSKTPDWNGRLQIGKYEFRLRSLDQRQVPGEWSGYADLDVTLEPVYVNSPAPQSLVKSTSSGNESEVEFKWTAVPQAENYLLTVRNSKNEVVFEEKTSSTSYSRKLESAQTYTYTIKAISGDLQSEFSDPVPFTLVGPALEKVKIEKPDNEFVREVKWAKPEKSENYDLMLARYNPTIKKWQKFKEIENFTGETLNFESDWPGGKYRLQVKSKASLREPSEPASLQFEARNGDRSPAAEYVSTMRKSIDRTNGWFAHLSWYASSIALSTAYKNTRGLGTNSITGTGRFGGGWLEEDSKWGFMAIADVGGFIFENAVYNFVGLEFSAIRKQEISDRADIRYHLGVFSKEFPALWITAASVIANVSDLNGADKKYSKGNVMGPHIGAEYWYSITPKLGLQANIHLYMPVVGLEFPNGGKISSPDPNLSVGALGSYRYSPRLTGLVGVNYRMESYNYTDSSDSAAWSGINFQSTNQVKTQLDGFYINLMAEYAF